MSSKIPFSKLEIDPLALIPRILFIGILCVCFYPVEPRFFFVISFFSYYMIAQLARLLLFPNALYKGIGLLKKADFEKAIPVIQESIDYFRKKPWVDRYRFPLLLSMSKRSLTEVMLCNLAYCYLKIGEVNKSKQLYESVLQEFPENIIAKTMLDTINLISADAVANKN